MLKLLERHGITGPRTFPYLVPLRPNDFPPGYKENKRTLHAIRRQNSASTTATSLTLEDPLNHAAWIEGAQARPFVVKEADYPHPRPNEVVIRNAAVAINPVDSKLQAHAFLPLEYPHIFGEDVAGEVVEVGSDVKGVYKGQRVIGHAQGLATGDTRNNAFQSYTAVPAHMTAQIPPSMSYEAASVLPLGISCASAGLFQKTHLAMQYPSVDAKRTDKMIFIWGGSSSVGSCAIQLAKAAGYKVATTAGKKNFDYCKAIGADYVFDYSSVDVTSDMISTLKGADFVGVYDAISEGETIAMSIKIVEALSGKGKVITTMPGTEKQSTDTVEIVSVLANSIAGNEVGAAIYRDFLPGALQVGKILPKPDALVIGHGLESIQAGCDKAQERVSGRMIVVSL